MSEFRPHPSVTEQQLSSHDQEEAVTRERRSGFNWRLGSVLIGAAAVGTSIAVMAGIGGGNASAEKAEPRSTSVSAGAAPGETNAGTPNETEYPEILTNENFAFHAEGKTYTYESFKEAAAIRVADAPTPEEGVDAMIEQGFGGILQAACNKEDLALYEKIAPISDVGDLKTLSERFYIPAYKEVLVSDKKVSGTSPEPMMEMLTGLNEYAAKQFEEGAAGATPYKSGFEVIDKLHVTDSNLYGQHEVAFTAVVNYTDNATKDQVDKTFMMDGVLVEDEENGTWEFGGGGTRQLNDLQKEKYGVA